MKSHQDYMQTTNETLFSKLLAKYIPYWPMFLVLAILSFGAAWAYINITPKKYQSTASLIIKDEKKGNDDSRIMESLNLMGSKKIIENEIEVLKSRPVIETVVKNFRLYAPVYLEEGFLDQYLYEKAPLTIESLDPQSIKNSEGKLYLQLDAQDHKTVFINGKKAGEYGSWLTTEFGILRFNVTDPLKLMDPSKKYFFQLIGVPLKTQIILDNLKVSSANKLSSVIELKYNDFTPKLAQDILDQVILSYNAASINEKNALAKSTLAFIEQRLNVVGAQLNTIEQQIQQYKAQSGAFDISTQGQLFLQNVSSNDQKLGEINVQLSLMNDLQSQLENNTSLSGNHTVLLGNVDPILTQMIGSLNDAELEREKLKKTVAENNPMLISISDQITKIKENINNNIKDQRRNLEATKGNLFATNTNYNNLLHDIPVKERALLEISREQNIKSGIYSFLLQKREESELSFVSNIAESRIINHAQALNNPVSPNVLIVFGMALCAVFGIPVTLIGVKETLSSTILYRSEIESMVKVPIIGEIEYHKKSHPLAIENGKRSLAAEEFRRLRYAMKDILKNTANKSLLITSSISGEGKSYIAANLAISYSLTGKKVLLIDFDLHNSSLGKIFDSSDTKGVTDILLGNTAIDKLVKHVPGYENLYFLPAGSIHDEPSGILESQRTLEMLSFLEREYDLLIIDSPPVALVTDAHYLTNLCAATIYAVRHGFTPKSLLKRFETNNAIHPLVNPLIVFNGVKTRGFAGTDNGYGYGYKYGYGRSTSIAR
jgi:capsular exopolysaccharide synthesis family protein